MLVTPNCMVNPTAARARIEAVTRPNPIAGPRNCISSLVFDERDDPADAPRPADELPREGADQAPGVGQLVNVAAEVLGMDDSLGERYAVHRIPHLLVRVLGCVDPGALLPGARDVLAVDVGNC